jgi:hypothetical protein
MAIQPMYVATDPPIVSTVTGRSGLTVTHVGGMSNPGRKPKSTQSKKRRTSKPSGTNRSRN